MAASTVPADSTNAAQGTPQGVTSTPPVSTGVPGDRSSGNGSNGRAHFVAETGGMFSSLISSVRTFTSDLFNRRRFRDYGPGFGYAHTYDGERDLYQALGYKRYLQPTDYRNRYRRGGIARRVVDAYPRAAWAGGATIVEDEDPDIETTFESKTIALFDRLKAWDELQRISTIARLGEYAAILIGAPAPKIGGEADLTAPLGKVSGPDDILFLRCLPQDYAKVVKVVEDTTDARFGLPLEYEVTLTIPISNILGGASADGSSITGRSIIKRVHYTRIIHVAENLLLNKVYGSSALEPTWNGLDNYDKVMGGGAEAAWQRVNPGMQIDVDKDMLLTPEAERNLDDDVEDYIHDPTRRIMKTRGVKVTMLNSAVNAFNANADCCTRDICGTGGIPHRILMGSERGEMSSTQDRDNWSDRVSEYRKENCLPTLDDLIDRFIECGALPAPKLGSYDVVWPDEEELNEAEKGTLIVQYTTANVNQHNAGEPPVITTNEIRTKLLDYGPIEDVWEDPAENVDANSIPAVDANGNPIMPPTPAVDPTAPAPTPAPVPIAATTPPATTPKVKTNSNLLKFNVKVNPLRNVKLRRLRQIQRYKVASCREMLNVKRGFVAAGGVSGNGNNNNGVPQGNMGNA
jgi:hypothetical protein